MKTRSVLIVSTIFAALSAPALTWAVDSDTDRAHPETFVKDSAITTAVKTNLTKDHASSLARIHVDTDKDGIVWLSGTVESQGVASRAVQIAKATDGVRSVHSDIKVEAED